MVNDKNGPPGEEEGKMTPNRSVKGICGALGADATDRKIPEAVDTGRRGGTSTTKRDFRTSEKSAVGTAAQRSRQVTAGARPRANSTPDRPNDTGSGWRHIRWPL